MITAGPISAPPQADTVPAREASDRRPKQAVQGNQALLRGLQLKLAGAAGDPIDREEDVVSRNVRETLNSPGKPLDPELRAFFEPRFGRDFGNVRVHRDDRAAQSALDLGALAYTSGNDLVFAPGAYAPTEASGRRLIAHELSHVVQQSQSRTAGIQRDTPASPPARANPAPAASKRPSGTAFWGAYQQIGYNRWQGEEKRIEVWKFIGGDVGKAFKDGNTCAARVSYGLNYGDAPINYRDESTSYYNEPHRTFEGKPGDGKNYIVGAPALNKYLRKEYGKPDVHLRTRPEAVAFESTLKPGECAIFAGAHHSGLIMGGNSYADPYLIGNRDVTSDDPGGVLFNEGVDVWKLD